MSLRIPRKAAGIIAAALISAAAIAGCSSSDSGGSHLPAGSTTILANPTVSADVAKAEALLTANFKKDFSAAHPIASMKQAITDTFPQGNLADIENYAVQTFNVHVVHPGPTKPNPARAAWIQAIVLHALAKGAAPSASPGTANIPGTTASGSPS